VSRSLPGLAVLLIAAGCARNLPCPFRSDTQLYQESLRLRVLDGWQLPERSDPAGSVWLRFRLARNGEVIFSEVVAATAPELGASALESLRSLQPEPMTGSARCLEGATWTETFRPNEVGRAARSAQELEQLALSRSCELHPEVVAYVSDLRERVYGKWVMPDRLLTGMKAVVRFQLDATGALADANVVESTPPAFGDSVLSALRETPATPLEGIPSCLARRWLRATFELRP